jgi:hypothetical protein
VATELVELQVGDAFEGAQRAGRCQPWVDDDHWFGTDTEHVGGSGRRCLGSNCHTRSPGSRFIEQWSRLRGGCSPDAVGIT